MAYPTSPLVQLSGRDASFLVGPPDPPVGAVVVNPGFRSIIDANTANPPGTTFYIETGTHVMGADAFAQVEPKAGNTYIGAPGAIVTGDRVCQYAFGGTAANVTIKYLDVRDFICPRDELVVNHNFGTGWVMERNKIWRNKAGALGMGQDNVARYNLLTLNGQYGLQAFYDNATVEYNEISFNATDDWEQRIWGCGCTGGTKFWDVIDAKIRFNWVHNNSYTGIWADTNNGGFLVEGNYINDNGGPGFFYEISYNFRVVDNNFVRNNLRTGRQQGLGGDTFPYPAIYISESGGDSRVFGGVYADCPIEDNNFEDNWANVALWENYNRFGHDHSANTSTGYTTLLVPGGMDCHTNKTVPCPAMAGCGNPATGGSIDTEPWLTDCRWYTKNVKVRRNTFDLVPERVGIDPVATPAVGLISLFGEGGTSPAWNPYTDPTEVVFNQANVFSDNTYRGLTKWQAQDRVFKSFATWRGSPYNQDVGSTYTP